MRWMAALCLTGCGLGAGPTITASRRGTSYGVEGGLAFLTARANVGHSVRCDGNRLTYGAASLAVPYPLGIDNEYGTAYLHGTVGTVYAQIGRGADRDGRMFIGGAGTGGWYLHKRDNDGHGGPCRDDRACVTFQLTFEIGARYARGWELWIHPRVDALAFPPLP